MPASTNQIPDIELSVMIQVMRKHFQIVTEPVDGKPYAIRFVGTPYNTFVEDCRHIQVMAHGKGTKLSPHNVKSVLSKFDIPEADFMEAFVAFSTGAQLPEARLLEDGEEEKPKLN